MENFIQILKVIDNWSERNGYYFKNYEVIFEEDTIGSIFARLQLKLSFYSELDPESGVSENLKIFLNAQMKNFFQYDINLTLINTEKSLMDTSDINPCPSKGSRFEISEIENFQKHFSSIKIITKKVIG